MRLLVNILETLNRDPVMDWFEALPRNLPEGTETKTQPQQSDSELRWEPRTFQIRSKISNHFTAKIIRYYLFTTFSIV
jgi:hypothetical protein